MRLAWTMRLACLFAHDYGRVNHGYVTCRRCGRGALLEHRGPGPWLRATSPPRAEDRPRGMPRRHQEGALSAERTPNPPAPTRLVPLASMMERQNQSVTCPGCTPIQTFGLAWGDDPRYLGPVGADGLRHDPLRHAEDCTL